MKTAIYILCVLLVLLIALFVGKTSISAWHITIERPVTAILFILTCIAGWFNK